MATEIVMPKLGLTMESGAISAWLVAEGQEVQKGQALLEIATDKVTMEVEAQADGILRKIYGAGRTGSTGIDDDRRHRRRGRRHRLVRRRRSERPGSIASSFCSCRSSERPGFANSNSCYCSATNPGPTGSSSLPLIPMGVGRIRLRPKRAR